MDLGAYKGKTPLMLAAEKNSELLAGALLDHGADPSVRDDDGETALHKVRYSYSLIKLLLDYGADPMAIDDRGDPAYRSWSYNYMDDAQIEELRNLIDELLQQAATS